MKCTDTDDKSIDQDAVRREIMDLPPDHVLCNKSFDDLVELIDLCPERESGRFLILDRELKKRLATDQARINFPYMLRAARLGAIIGGLFALSGVFLGYCLKEFSSHSQVSVSKNNNEIIDSKFSKNLEGDLSINQPVISPPLPNKKPISKL